MKHSRVGRASFAPVLRPLAVLSPLAGIAASLAGTLPARAGDVVFTERVISTSADLARSVFATDVDGDGDTDVLSASYLDDKIAGYENTPAPPGIPTVSHWGLIASTLFVVIAGTLEWRRRRAAQA